MKDDFTFIPVIIVGGGQAGLSMSYTLKEKEIPHLIFDRGQTGDSWRKRWDNFTLVTPNWQCEMPGYKYSGSEPHGFMNREQVVQFVQDYARSFDPPLKNGVEVFRVKKKSEEYIVETSIGNYRCYQVIIAAGAFHDVFIPPVAKKLPSHIQNMHSSQYRNASSMPDQGIMVVGSGQSGCQIAEDLHLEGKKVHLCIGDAPKSPRNYRGRDVVDWLDDMNYYDRPIDSFPDPEAVRKKTNHYLTGRDGGREIDLRAFALEGMKLYGVFKDADENKIYFGDNLTKDLDNADNSAQSIKDRIDIYIEENNIQAPTEAPYVAPWRPEDETESIDLVKEDIGVIIWCVGYKTDFSWIDIPVFTEKGYPIYERGVTNEEGLYFLGLPWMYTWGSGRFSGITQDAWYLAERVAEKMVMDKV